MQKLKKKEKKLTAAQRELAAAEAALLAKWQHIPKFGRGTPPKKIEPVTVVVDKPTTRRVEAAGKSVMTPGGSTALKPSPKYTGDNMIGIATMHKSNAVPVFDSKAAVEVTTMRRG